MKQANDSDEISRSVSLSSGGMVDYRLSGHLRDHDRFELHPLPGSPGRSSLPRNSALYDLAALHHDPAFLAD